MKTLPTFLILLVACGLGYPATADASRHSRKRVSQTAPDKAPASSATGETASDGQNNEERRYQEIKARAKADPVVQSLKAKSEAAATEAESRAAAISYNRALFRKVRELDGSLAERAELVENAIIRRINE